MNKHTIKNKPSQTPLTPAITRKDRFRIDKTSIQFPIFSFYQKQVSIEITYKQNHKHPQAKNQILHQKKHQINKNRENPLDLEQNHKHPQNKNQIFHQKKA